MSSANLISLILFLITVVPQNNLVLSEIFLDDKDENGCGIGEEFRNGTCRLCKPGTYRFFTLAKLPAKNPLLCRSEDEFGSNIPTSDTQCVLCPRGTYNPFVGGMHFGRCRPCPVGTTSWRGAKRCRPCRAGKSSSLGSPRCVKCRPGSFMSNPCQYGAALNTSCTKCPKGTYSSKFNSEKCVLCPEGSSTLRRGATSISQCKLCGTEGVRCSCQQEGEPKNAVGSYRPIGNSVCTKCPPGTKARTPFATKASECYPCPNGTLSIPFEGCVKCDKGFHSFGVGASSCREKEDGDCLFEEHFKDPDGVCKRCPSGYKFEGDRCTKCPPGTVSQGFGQKICVKCEVPLAAPQNGDNFCECARNYFFDYEDTYDCKPCPNGTSVDKEFHMEEECEVDCSVRADLPQCTSCEGDYERDRKTQKCVKCKKGFRSLVGEENCVDPRTGCSEGAELLINPSRWGYSLTCVTYT